MAAMKNHIVLGVHAPPPRLAPAGLALFSAALALPAGLLLWLTEWLLL
ncbi:hypothetical protein MAA5396_01220 [Marinovum algicola]|jgi:hypothetical protein|uniref:Uncharacterized protein n=1 Tax=Marinovum algicola TaxID=42444 RepID=A0A975ZLG8_9RHOB|nr:hypothetical protein MALG_00666 [Marinovum algicola DG 898]SEI56436.1 hypothetical protein SAMN04487940_101237 [Marinovum algicola]SLN28408.1 hypothetical protein MAA5396_01220 [Marinovum algicola]